MTQRDTTPRALHAMYNGDLRQVVVLASERWVHEPGMWWQVEDPLKANLASPKSGSFYWPLTDEMLSGEEFSRRLKEQADEQGK